MATANAEHAKSWRAANYSKFRAGLKSYYDANRAAILEKQRAYYHKNHERALAMKRLWREANRDACLEACRAWSKANPAKKHEYRRRRRAAKLGAPVCDFTLAQWRLLVVESQGRCHYCGEIRKLTPDHKQPLTRGGAHTLTNIVPACMGCNRRKGPKTYDEFQAYLQGVSR